MRAPKGCMRELIINSLTDPARGAVDLLRMNFNIQVLLQAAVAVTALTTLMGLLTVMASGGPVDVISATMSNSPLSFAIMQFAMFLFMSGMIFVGGRAFGGVGSLQGSLLVGVWIGVMQLIIQVAQLLVMSISPLIAGMMSLAALVWLFWALTQFVKVLHGFQNGFVVFFGIMLVFVVSVFLAAIALAMTGAIPEELLKEMSRVAET